MPYCGKCGSYIDDSMNSCPSCGAVVLQKKSTDDNSNQNNNTDTIPNNNNNNNYYTNYPSNGSNGNGKGIASLVLGIVSIVFSSSGFIGIVTGIIGIALASAQNKENKNGITNAGFVLSIIGLIISVLCFISCSCIGCFSDNYIGDRFWREFREDILEEILD